MTTNKAARSPAAESPACRVPTRLCLRAFLAYHASMHLTFGAHIYLWTDRWFNINQTFVRSIMTSVTVLIALAALYLFGPESTRTLSIAMFLGMFFGTYSSIFLASPLLVVWDNWRHKK